MNIKRIIKDTCILFIITIVSGCLLGFVYNSTKDKIHVEVCNECHPFYTGKQTTGNRKGQVDKFNKKYGFDKKEA